MSLPSLEAPPLGTYCPVCGALVELVDPIFCAECDERDAQELARAREEGGTDVEVR